MGENMTNTQIHCQTRLRIYTDDLAFGPGVAELVERVAETSSLSEACRQMQMSYSKGWKMLKRSEKSLGYAIVAGSRGGQNGGKMILTEAGKDLLQRYREFEEEATEEVKQVFDKHFNKMKKERL